MTDFKMGARVTLLNSKKLDGRYNHGIIVGIDKVYPYLGYRSESQYLKGFKIARYKVAYVDCFNRQACADWVSPNNITKYNKNYGKEEE